MGITGHEANFRRLVVIDRLQVRIRNRFNFRRKTSPGAKTELRMSRRADSNPYMRLVGGTFDQEGVTGIVVLALIERAKEPDARLNCNDEAFHGGLQYLIAELDSSKN